MVPVWMILSDLKPRVQGHDIIQRQITQKRYKIKLYLQWRTNRSRIWSIEPWTTPNSVSKVTLFFDALTCRHPRRRSLRSSSVALDITSSPPAASLHVDLSQVLAVVRRGCLLGRLASLAVVTVEWRTTVARPGWWCPRWTLRQDN